MFNLTFNTIRAKKARFLLTATAVMLGVAFMAGTLVLTDTIKQSYDRIAGNVFAETDAVVRSRHSISAEAETSRALLGTDVLAAPCRRVPGDELHRVQARVALPRDRDRGRPLAVRVEQRTVSRHHHGDTRHLGLRDIDAGHTAHGARSSWTARRPGPGTSPSAIG
jgi:hypothetical protein